MKAYIVIDSSGVIQRVITGDHGALVIDQTHIEIPIEDAHGIIPGVSKYINGTVVNA